MVRQSQKQVKDSLLFLEKRIDSIIFKWSSQLVNLTETKVEPYIHLALADLIKNTRFDWAGFFKLEKSEQSISGIIAWLSRFQNNFIIRPYMFPWISRELLDNHIIRILQTDDLPSNSNDRKTLRRFHVKSMLIVPITWKHRVAAAMAVGTRTNLHTWPKPLEMRLRLFGEIIMNAYNVQFLQSPVYSLHTQDYGSPINDKLSEMVIQKKTKMAMKKLSLVVKQSPNIIVITDTDGTIEYVNESFCLITGYGLKEVVTQNPRILKSGKHSLSFYQNLWDTISSGKIWKGELINRRKDGSIYWEQASIYPLRDEKQRITHYIKVSEDISLRKTSEKEIMERETQYRTVVDQASDGIYLVDFQGQIRDINKSGCKMLGYSKDEMLQKTMDEIITPESLSQMPIQYDKLKKGRTVRLERQLRKKDGSICHVEISEKSLPNGLILKIVRDVTQRHEIETQVQKDLREKEVLLKEIHHRVKNNLQIIISLLNLQSTYIKDKAAIHAFKESKNRIRSMAIVHEKLYRSKNFASIDFREYTFSIIQELRRIYNMNPPIEVEIQIDDIRLDLDTAVPCGLILNELVTNAVKHAFPDGQNGKIIIQFKKERKYNVFVVSDNGKGFEPMPNLLFADSLGLKLVGILTEQLNGTIQINSINGTRFEIRFPKKRQLKKADDE